MKKLEIGPGKKKIASDWITLNAIKSPCTDHVATWGEDRLPFKDDSFDLVYASHCLEHVPWFNTIKALQEARRVLKKDGVIEIWVPDFKYVVECYSKQECGDKWRKFNKEGNYMQWVNGRIFTYGEFLHSCVFDKEHLSKCLNTASFREIKPLKKPRGYDHGKINLGLRGIK